MLLLIGVVKNPSYIQCRACIPVSQLLLKVREYYGCSNLISPYRAGKQMVCRAGLAELADEEGGKDKKDWEPVLDKLQCVSLEFLLSLGLSIHLGPVVCLDGEPAAHQIDSEVMR